MRSDSFVAGVGRTIPIPIEDNRYEAATQHNYENMGGSLKFGPPHRGGLNLGMVAIISEVSAGVVRKAGDSSRGAASVRHVYLRPPVRRAASRGYVWRALSLTAGAQ